MCPDCLGDILLSLTADNEYSVFADGTWIGNNKDWTKVQTYSIPDHTQIVGVYAINYVSMTFKLMHNILLLLINMS